MFAILATGPSLSLEQVEAVRSLRVVVISDAYRLAPWAEALVSSDTAWWRYHKPEFVGLRFSAQGCDGTQKMAAGYGGCNSGVMGIKVARQLGARRIVLLGFNGHGSHFFGPHPKGLKNTDDKRRKVHLKQHAAEAKNCAEHGIEIINCTHGTSLTCYPIAKLEDVLC